MNGWQDNIKELETKPEEEYQKPEKSSRKKEGRERKAEKKKEEKERKEAEKKKAEEEAVKALETPGRKLTLKEKRLVRRARKRARKESGESRQRKISLIRRLWGFAVKINEDHVPAYATEAAFFMIMSFIPFLLFMTTLIRYTPLSYNMVRDAIVSVMPQNLQAFVLEIVADVYRRNTAVAPLSAIAMLWAAGKGVQAITNGLNVIYRVRETRNWLINRIYSIFYIILFAIAIILNLFLLVLGTQIKSLLEEYNIILGGIIGSLLGLNDLLVFGVLFVVFLVVYRFLPNRKASLKSQVPGALITAAAWMVFSFFFSLYYELFPTMISNMYGNVTSLILMMMWVYFCMNILLLGAEVNSYFERELRKMKTSIAGKIRERTRKNTPQRAEKQ